MKKIALSLLLTAIFASAGAQEAKTHQMKSTVNYYDFVKNYVEAEVNEWTKPLHDKYETESAYHRRVNETTRADYAEKKAIEATQLYSKMFSKTIDLSKFYTNKDYWDWSGTGSFTVKSPQFNYDFTVEVGDDGTYFVNNFSSFQKQVVNLDFSTVEPTFDIEFKGNSGKKYIAQRGKNAPKQSGKIVDSKDFVYNPMVYKSDVDNIPDYNGPFDNNTFALCIGNANYFNHNSTNNLQNLKYATQDAEIFAKYCKNVLHINPENIVCLKDAIKSDMQKAVKAFLDKPNINKSKEISLIFYYSGHGIADPDSKKCVLIPAMENGRTPEDCIKIADFYDEMKKYSNAKLTMFIDACFSGYSKGDEYLAGFAGTKGRITPVLGAPDVVADVVLFSACAENEYANEYDKQGHGYFTYFLLKNMKELADENSLTYGKLYQAVYDGVKNVFYTQNPKVIVHESLEGKWENYTLKRIKN